MPETSKPEYSDRDPKGYCGDPRRGSAMGRGTHKGPKNYAGKIFLRRVYIDNGGYDVNGTYFGHGKPLYWYACEHGVIDGVVRSNAFSYPNKAHRASARTQVLTMYPKAKVRV